MSTFTAAGINAYAAAHGWYSFHEYYNGGQNGQNLWAYYPIFERYLGALARQVSGLGGNPAGIPASGTGVWPGGASGHGAGAVHRPVHASGLGSGRRHDAPEFVGKIEGLIFDHFGDFEGFIPETEVDERLHFYSREKNLKAVAERAWAARLRVTVVPDDENERHPRRIVLHFTPGPL
jgi:hypothetical protein